ncbi:MAG TPA: ABC transporter ATP-binding protein, partial [Candidatus Binataceae bacterium]|nr:ABC transporter ATP-binding protein [Candidatus Binataceae bacterium]
ATNRLLTAALVGLYLLQSILPAAQALATRGVIDTAVGQLRTGSMVLRPMLAWLTLAFVATLADGLGGLAQDYSSRRLEDDLNLELNSMILIHAADLDVSFFESPSSQDVLFRARQNAAGSVSRFVGGSLNVISNMIQILSLLAIVVAIEPLILIVIVVAAVPYMRFQWSLTQTRYGLERSRATKRRWTQYFVSSLTDSGSVPEAKILDLAPMMIAKFRAMMAEFRDQDRGLLIRSTRAAAIFSGFATTAIYALFARVALRVLRGSSTMGDLAIFGAAAARLRLTVEGEISSIASLLEQMLNISNLQELLAAKPLIVSTAEPTSSHQYRGEIEFEGVSFTYNGSTQPALQDVSLKVRAGETLAIVGENGSGKTTLVKLIVRFYDPTVGCVRIDGQDLKSIDPKDLQSRISFVFQNFGRYEASVAENISYGDWRQLAGEAEQIERVATKAGIDEMIRRLPAGYETLVGRQFGGYDLSIGQWQRVALARAFARHASIVILDEPTSNLDAQAEYELFMRCRSLARGRTTITVSHRFSTVRIADRIVVMERGRIVEVGSHEELLRNAGHYTRLYDRATRSDRGASA